MPAWQAVIYGSDDRSEVYEYDRGDWARNVATSSIVALGRLSELAPSADGIVLAVPTAGERFALCPEERFSDQPAFADCTGVALTPDLVLTAAHCLRSGPLSELVALSGYYYEQPGQLASIAEASAHAIGAIVYEDAELGYAWLRLEHGGAFGPLGFQRAPVLRAMPIVSVNHGASLPAKIDKGGKAFPIGDQAFLATTDAFGGASGGPLFSLSGDLLGILISGSADYRMTSRGCRVAAQLPDEEASANEFAVHIEVAVKGLCAHHPDPAICTVDTTDVPSGPTCALRRRLTSGSSAGWMIGMASLGSIWFRRRHAQKRALFRATVGLHRSRNGVTKSTEPSRLGRSSRERDLKM